MISQRIRLHVNTTTKKIGVDVLTAATPHLLKPSATQFEVALFEDDASDIKDITGIDQITLSVKAKDPRTGLAVMQQTLAVASLNTLLTAEQWETNAPDMCHALFEFTATETNVELEDDEVEFYIVIAGLTADAPAKEIPFGNGSLIIEESGAFVDAPAEVTDAEFYTKAQSDARYLLAADLTGKLNRSGGSMTGFLTLHAAPTANLHAATKAYVDAAQAAAQTASVAKSGGVMTGLLTLSGAPTSALHAATRQYVIDTVVGLVPVAGGTMTGLLTLSGNPTSANHAANKTYVDTFVSKAGATMTGALTLSGAPTSALHAATKAYVDTAVANLVASSPGALDTLNELAAALGNDAAFSTTVTTSIATKLPLAGGTLTGALTLSGNPTSSNHAANKSYVDTFVPLAGGTLTGLLTLSGAPTSALHAATKNYVDTADALKLSLTGGTLSGALQFSGSTHAGLRVNNLTSTQITALGAAADGYVVYDSTLEQFKFREASTWKVLGGTGGSGWLSGSADPDNGDGVDGNYYLKDDGSIWLKSGGAWSVFVAARLPLAGGTVTGAITFDAALDTSIAWNDGYGVAADAASLKFIFGGLERLEICGSGHATVPGGNTNLVGNLYIGGTKVLGAQGAAIGSLGSVGGTATNGGWGFSLASEFNTFLTGVGNINTVVNYILDRLRNHGIIAT